MAARDGPELTEEAVREAIEQANGLIHVTAALLQCTPRTVHRWLQDYPALSQLKHEVEDRLLDVAESQVYKGVQDGDRTMVIFFLKTRGRHRGWSERLEIERRDPLPPLLDMGRLTDEELVDLEGVAQRIAHRQEAEAEAARQTH